MKVSYFIMLSFIFLISLGCNDPCNMVDCGQNGVCIEGDCECDPGYGGKYCENQNCVTDFFVGTFSTSLQCEDDNTSSYIIKLEKLSDTSLTMIIAGVSVDLNLDLDNCTATGENLNFFFNRYYTLTYIGNRALQLEVRSNGLLVDENSCKGTMTN